MCFTRHNLGGVRAMKRPFLCLNNLSILEICQLNLFIRNFLKSCQTSLLVATEKNSVKT